MKLYELISRMSTKQKYEYCNLVYKLALINRDIDEIGACIYYSVIWEGK